MSGTGARTAGRWPEATYWGDLLAREWPTNEECVRETDAQARYDHPDLRQHLERVTRIELALSAWEADVLPLNYTRGARNCSRGGR
jgi:hypothetical protein